MDRPGSRFRPSLGIAEIEPGLRLGAAAPPLSAANAALKQLRQLYALDEKLALEDTIGGIVQAILDFGSGSQTSGTRRQG